VHHRFPEWHSPTEVRQLPQGRLPPQPMSLVHRIKLHKEQEAAAAAARQHAGLYGQPSAYGTSFEAQQGMQGRGEAACRLVVVWSCGARRVYIFGSTLNPQTCAGRYKRHATIRTGCDNRLSHLRFRVLLQRARAVRLLCWPGDAADGTQPGHPAYSQAPPAHMYPYYDASGYTDLCLNSIGRRLHRHRTPTKLSSKPVY
jgi:hypothetical protein